MPSEVESRFLEVVKRVYREVRKTKHGNRSNRKTKILHGWLQEEFKSRLGDEYEYVGQSETQSSEATVQGRYYGKKVDLLIRKGEKNVGVVSAKFVMGNYRQNSVNYFEQQMGETANLRRQDIVYGNLFCLTYPTPYRKKDGSVSGYERFGDKDIERYVRLAEDHGNPHVPDRMAIGIVLLDEQTHDIAGLATAEDLSGHMSSENIDFLREKLGLERFFEIMVKAVRLKAESL